MRLFDWTSMIYDVIDRFIRRHFNGKVGGLRPVRLGTRRKVPEDGAYIIQGILSDGRVVKLDQDSGEAALLNAARTCSPLACQAAGDHHAAPFIPFRQEREQHFAGGKFGYLTGDWSARSQ
jgi:hypothetical protein